MDELKKVEDVKKMEGKEEVEEEKVISQALTSISWDRSTPHADKFAIKGNTITKISGGLYQLVGSDPLPKGSTTIKATIKKYGGWGEIGFGLLTESRRNEQWSGY